MKPRHMSAEEFRRYGHELVDWIARYLETVGERRVLPTVEPGEIRGQIPQRCPEDPEPFAAILADLDRVVMPGIAHWQSPRWFAYFPSNSSPASILADLASAGLGVQGMSWSTSPACTEVEMVVLDWLVDLLGVPEGWKTTGPGGGVIQMSASDSTHLALVVARQEAARRAPGSAPVAYCSREAHSSVEKGARVAGYEHLRQIDVDDSYALRPEALAAQVDADRAQGLTPAFACTTVGTTGTTAVDPLRAVGEIAVAQGIWHHVDAAYAGTAMLCPELRHHQDGLELVDSYTFNPHKWMLVNFDCNVFWVADRRPLLEALSILPPYLRHPSTDSGRVIDYRDWHLPLGRRFRALKLWFVLRSYGAAGLRAMIREHLRLAGAFAARVEADPRFALVAPVPFGLVCFRHVAGNDATRALAQALNESGRVAVTPSSIGELAFIRISIGQARTEARHVDELWELVDRLAPK